MKTKLIILGSFGLAMTLSACATAPVPIYAEPVFDKYGNPDCRPGDVPIGGAYTADLPLCALLSDGTTRTVGTNDGGTSSGDSTVPTEDPVDPVDPVDPPVDPVDPPIDPVDDGNGNNPGTGQGGNPGTGQGGNPGTGQGGNPDSGSGGSGGN